MGEAWLCLVNVAQQDGLQALTAHSAACSLADGGGCLQALNQLVALGFHALGKSEAGSLQTLQTEVEVTESLLSWSACCC